MNNEQRLYPLRIYQINQALEEFKRVCGIGETRLINYGVLDYKNRKFNWTVVHNERWSFDDDIIENIKKHKESLETFLKKVEDENKDFDIIKESVKEARNILLQNKGGNKELHHHLLNLYHFYPHKSDLFADGIIYRNFIKRSKRLLYATGELLIEKKEYGLGKKGDTPYSLYPWIDMTFVYDDGEKVRSLSCQEDKKDIEYTTQANRDKKLREALNHSFLLELYQSIYFSYLTPLFAGYKVSNSDELYKGESPLKKDSLKQSITAFKYMLYIPVYDASIGGQLFGNFCGNISIPFAFKEDMEEFKNRYLNRILENAYLLMRATTPLHEILKQRMEERDLLEHFIKNITMVQDWEKVMVWKKGEEKRVSYCYKRENGDSWVECVANINNENCKKCKSYYDDLKNWVQKSNNCHLATDEEAFKIKHSKRKILLESIFTKKFIPELVDETRYSDIALVFEYPRYTIFPSGESTTHKLGISYERQHVEILRQMYSQEERIRHAIHSAAVTIMVRNFSHHHGSHVIPRLEIKGREDAIKEYLYYLQEKSGLFTIIGISEPICEGIVNLIDKLNFLRNNEGIKLFLECFAKASETGASTVTLNEPTINKFDNNEVIVSPGYGDLGIHALYIIFENYVRNLLKHCTPINGDKKDPIIGFDVKKVNNFAEIKIFTKDYIVKDKDANESYEKIYKIINNSSLIDDMGQPDFKSPGIKEMRICANILAGKELGEKGAKALKPMKESKFINYSFRMPLARYVIDSYDVNTTFNNIKEGKESKPIFLIVNTKDYENTKNNWNLTPQKICWIVGEDSDIGNKPDDEWIKRRSLFIQHLEWDEYKGKSEKEKYCFILKKWIDKQYEKLSTVKFYNTCSDNNQTIKEYQSIWDCIVNKLNSEKLNKNKTVIFCHNCKENQGHLLFTHNSQYRIYRSFIVNKDRPSDLEKKVIVFEICSILSTKIIIFDDEIYERAKDKIAKLKEIDLIIKSEKEVPGDKDNLKNYHCVVFHLGKLDVEPDIYTVPYDNLPPYVRIVTGRPRPLEEEILNKCLWAHNQQIDRSVFLRALSEQDVFEIKYKIYWALFS